MKFTFIKLFATVLVFFPQNLLPVQSYSLGPLSSKSNDNFYPTKEFQQDFKSWLRGIAAEAFGNSFAGYFDHGGKVVTNQEGGLPSKRSNSADPVDPFTELCSWESLEWNLNSTVNCTEPASLHKYPPQNKIPFGIAQFDENRICVTVPRLHEGVVSTLNVISRNDFTKGEKCPKLNPYPSFNHNVLHSTCCNSIYDRFVSVWRVNVDQCITNPRIWFCDTGVADYPTQSIKYKQPTLNIIDIKTNVVITSRVIPFEVVKIPNGLKVVVPYVDPLNCDTGYGYVVDSVFGQIITYSITADRFWVFKHNYFKLTPLESTFQVLDGEDVITYDVNDNIYSLAVDTHEGVVYLHPRGSQTEFQVELSDLNNRTLASCLVDDIEVDIAGQFGAKGQVGPHFVTNGTMWGVQEQKHGVFCLNTEDGFDATTYTLIAANATNFPFVVDINQFKHNILVLSNSYEQIKENGFRQNHKHFRIFEACVGDLLNVAPKCIPKKDYEGVLDTRDGVERKNVSLPQRDGSSDSEEVEVEGSAVKSGATTRQNGTKSDTAGDKNNPDLRKNLNGNEVDAELSEDDDTDEAYDDHDDDSIKEDSAVLSGSESRSTSGLDQTFRSSSTNEPPFRFRNSSDQPFRDGDDNEGNTSTDTFNSSNQTIITSDTPSDGDSFNADNHKPSHSLNNAPSTPNSHNNPVNNRRPFKPNPNSPLYQFFQGPIGYPVHETQDSDQHRGGVGTQFFATNPRVAHNSSDDEWAVQRSQSVDGESGVFSAIGSPQYIYLNIVNTCQQQVGCPFSDKCRALSLCGSFSEVQEMSPDLQKHLKEMCLEYLCNFCNYCSDAEKGERD